MLGGEGHYIPIEPEEADSDLGSPRSGGAASSPLPLLFPAFAAPSLRSVRPFAALATGPGKAGGLGLHSLRAPSRRRARAVSSQGLGPEAVHVPGRNSRGWALAGPSRSGRDSGQLTELRSYAGERDSDGQISIPHRARKGVMGLPAGMAGRKRHISIAMEFTSRTISPVPDTYRYVSEGLVSSVSPR